MQTLAVSKGLKVPCPLHDSWANAKSCQDISRLFKDYSLLSKQFLAISPNVMPAKISRNATDVFPYLSIVANSISLPLVSFSPLHQCTTSLWIDEDNIHYQWLSSTTCTSQLGWPIPTKACTSQYHMRCHCIMICCIIGTAMPIWCMALTTMKVQ